MIGSWGRVYLNASEECGHSKYIWCHWYAVISAEDCDCKPFQANAVDDELVLHLRIAPSDHYLTLRGKCTLRWDLGKTTTGEGDREVRIREADDSSFQSLD